MANPKIEVEIGASVKGLEAGVAKAENTLKGIGTAAQTTAPKVQQLARATSNYNGVGIEFSRIIQDAPFGIIGVGNNITQLASTFQQLRANSTSTGAALKTALASIISPANLLVLGISAVTTAFTLYSMGAFDSKDATEKLTDATVEAKEQLDKYVSSLDSVTKASLTGATATQNELSALRGLQIQAENLNIPINKRIEAVDELQKQFPDYLGNLTQEQILTGDVGSAYSELTKQLIATGKARASVDSIAKNSIEILQLETRERERLEKIRALETQQAGASTFNPAQAGVIGGNLFSQADIISAKIRDVQKEGIDDRKRINDLTKENLNLESLITSEIEKGGSFTKTQIVTVKELNKEVETLKRTFEDISKTPVLAPRDNPFAGGLPTPVITQGVQTDPTDQMIESMRAGREVLANSYAEMKAQAEQFNQDISDIINNGAANTLGNFAFSIGDALASGGDVLKAAGASLLDGLASVLNQLGQLAIATGIGIKGIKTALKTLNPAVAIGAGVALVALAGFVSSKAKSLGGGPSSGGGGGGGSIGGGVASQSFTGTGLGALTSNELVGEFTVKGSDLVFVLSQEEKKRNKG